MSRPAIEVNELGKAYRIGLKAETHATFRDAVVNTFQSSLRRFGRSTARRATHEQFWALKDISFAIEPGEAIGIIGRNGAGKSTLLKILSRITEPTRGMVRLRGRVASLLEVGTGFHQELTGRENIYLNGAILGMRKAEIDRKFDEIVAFSEIEKFLDTPVKRYSSGMYVRLAFAVAAHLDPEILIVDEVLAVGDVEFQKKCLGKMEDVVSRSDRTILFVSHNMNAINRLCDRCVLLDRGHVVRDAPTAEVVQLYMNHAGGARRRFSAEPDESRDGQILNVELVDRGRKTVTGDHDQGQPFQVRITSFCKTDLPSGFLTLSLRDSMGTPVLFTDMRDTRSPGLKAGRTVHTVEFPSHLLAAGEYFLSLGMADPLLGRIDTLSNELSIRLRDFESVRGEQRLGYFGVRLPWKLTEVAS
jgi:lipopolysaccharide transport system ATP-binding protein